MIEAARAQPHDWHIAGMRTLQTIVMSKQITDTAAAGFRCGREGKHFSGINPLEHQVLKVLPGIFRRCAVQSYRPPSLIVVAKARSLLQLVVVVKQPRDALGLTALFLGVFYPANLDFVAKPVKIGVSVDRLLIVTGDEDPVFGKADQPANNCSRTHRVKVPLMRRARVDRIGCRTVGVALAGTLAGGMTSGDTLAWWLDLSACC
jgi:hypothetical protein